MPTLRSPADIVAMTAVGAGLLALAAVIAWHVANPEPVPATLAPAPVMADTEPAEPSRTTDYTAIADWQLFGEPAAEDPEPAGVDDGVAAIESMDALPESTVGLEVTGTVSATDTESARAIIMDSTGRQREYQIGDRLPGNIELHAVEPTRIVIRRNGVLEAIALPQPNELLPDHKSPAASNTSRNPSAPHTNLVAYVEL